MSTKPIAIYHEQQHWFKPLFAELEKRRIPYDRLDARQHRFDPSQLNGEERYGLIFNRMSPSAYNRGNVNSIFYTLSFLAHLELNGKRVINGTRAFRTELSKAFQISLLAKLGLGHPRTRVINHPEQAIAATTGLRWPIVVKPNIGGSGAGVRRFDSQFQLAEAIEKQALDLGIDHTALVQEYVPARGEHIVRVEVLGGKYLYAIRVHLTGDTFDLCPADICKTTDGVELQRAACPIDAPKSGLRVEAYEPPPIVIEQVERIMAEAGIEVGGIEYIIDDRDGSHLYYDINALSNFVADGPNVIGFDPFVPLVDFLEREAR